MQKITMLKTMDSAEDAQRVFDFFRDKGVDMSGAGIVDGSTFAIAVGVNEATIAASYFYDFFNHQ